MAGWESNLEGRERPPDEIAMQQEEANDPRLTSLEVELLETVRAEMRRLRPHLHVVFAAILEHAEVFGGTDLDDFDLRFKAYHGFIADLSRKLGISENGVRYRARSALRWFTKRARLHLEWKRRG